MHLCVEQKLELTEMPGSCVSVCLEYGMKKQTVFDNRKTVRPSEILSFYEKVLPIMQKAAQGNTQSHQNK